MNYKKIIWGVSSVATLAILGFSDAVNHFQYIFDRLDIYSKNEAPEKIYLHTDKQYYTNGETIWFKSYLVNGISHQSNTKSKVSYIELISPKDSIVARRTIFTDSTGSAGDIQIDKDWDTGIYLLRSYTNYMRNAKRHIFFQKEIPIWNQKITEEEIYQTSSTETSRDSLSIITPVTKKTALDVPILKFYPEGGQLIAGMKNTMGIHITDDQGRGISILGKIIDSKGNMVAPFRSYKYGLGKMPFTPKLREKYMAIININGKELQYPLPEIREKGYRLGVRNMGNKIVLDVESTEKNGLYHTLLIGHLRGKLFFKRIEPKGTNSYTMELLMSELDDGVAHFTLFTPSGIAVCERLVFVDNPENDVHLEIKSNKDIYKNRERIVLDMVLTDRKGALLKGDFSMSVVSSDSLEKKSETSDIRSWLLLDSDLKGTIENPGYFFEDNGSGNRKFLLDALMLTHGWRRFVWKEFLKTGNHKKELFPPEKGLFIKGKTTDYNKPFATKQSQTSLTFLEKGLYQDKAHTDERGKFSYGPFFFKDTAKTVIEAVFPEEKNKKKKKNISIYIDPPLPGPPVEHFERKTHTPINVDYIQQFLADSRLQKVSDFRYNPEATQLDEVVLSVKKKTLAERITEEHGTSQHRLIIDSVPGASSLSVIDMLRQISIVDIRGGYPNLQIYIRDIAAGVRVSSQQTQAISDEGFSSQSDSDSFVQSGALILIDEAEVPVDFINQMWASEIVFIDVLRPSEAIEYGTRAADGVVRIFTKRGTDFIRDQKLSPGITNFKVNGFYQAREFFAPDHSKKESDFFIPDYRTTLYWQPYVNFDGNKSVDIDTFYASDNKGNYIIKVEGITKDGRVVKQSQEISIE